MSDDYYVSRLEREQHAVDLQKLYEHCTDYVQLEFGVASHPTAAEEDFAFNGIMIFGIYSRDAHLIGVIEMLRDYPKHEEWWIALLMLDPSMRGRGFGERICATTFDWIAREGGRAVWLGVLEPNERAQKFWKRIGFVEVERQPYVARNGHETVVILMKRVLSS